MPTKKTIEDMHRLAESKGGACLSEKYFHSGVPLEWQCAEGHRWCTTPAAIRQGTWCPHCSHSRRRNTMQAVAARHGGRCLSDEYAGSFTPLEWECALGHRWKAQPASVKHRTWCPECARQKRVRYTLDDMQALAASHGGLCLSKSYVSGTSLMHWRCAHGHEWRAAPTGVLNGKWCRQCYYDSMRSTLMAMQELAASRGGSCLSTSYLNASSPLQWQCGSGHKWTAVAYSVSEGRWCPECAVLAQRHALETMQAVAIERGGLCLSNEYQGVHLKLTWQCHRGHVGNRHQRTSRTRGVGVPIARLCNARRTR